MSTKVGDHFGRHESTPPLYFFRMVRYLGGVRKYIACEPSSKTFAGLKERFCSAVLPMQRGRVAV